MKLVLPKQISDIFSFILSKLETTGYIVGGFTRDLILKRESKDIDIAAFVEEKKLENLFKDSYFYKKTATATFKIDDIHITIAPFREESEYKDFRHPSVVKFTDSLYLDYKRRDFTINSLYLDIDGNVIDPTNRALNDIENKQIVTIGDPIVRLQEDPLRIIRAYRFKYKLSFDLSKDLQNAILLCKDYLNYLNPNKIHEELLKIDKDYVKIVAQQLSLENLL